MRRYFQFALVLVSAGTIYPLLYLRQNFETSLLEAFSLNKGELGVLYSLLGVVFCATYVPSGWLADRFSPRRLIPLSLLSVAALGLWFSTFPTYSALRWIFIGWGLSTGLTFWAALIKSVKQLASDEEQGRFFGVLDGGRGLVEALLASVALVLFATLLHRGEAVPTALRAVIYLYCAACSFVAVLIFLFLKDAEGTTAAAVSRPRGGLWSDLLLLLSQPSIWLVSLVIFCGYQVFWSTYAFSAYLQEAHGMTAVTAGFLTVTKLWMRPLGGMGAGFLGDRFSNSRVLSTALVLVSAALAILVLCAGWHSPVFLMVAVSGVGLLVYAIRGLYWAILNNCEIPARVTGLAIGVVSMLGYLPDILSPLIHAGIMTRFPGVHGYQVYFTYIAGCGLVGAWAARSPLLQAKKKETL